jgi:hypothetical protein
MTKTLRAVVCLSLAIGHWSLIIAAAAPQCPGGACQPANPAHPAVARIANARAGSTCYGSGTLVRKEDGRGLVLTCAHLFRGGIGEVNVAFPGASQHKARVLAVDETWDLAALEIAEPSPEPIAIAADPPQPGESLQSCGFGSDGRYWCSQGRVLGYARPAGGTTRETLTLTGSAREGDSGGPVFNARGELVAVVWGTDGRTVEGTYCGRIRRFLAGIVAPGRRPAPLRPVPPGASPPATTPPPAAAPPAQNPGPAAGSLLEELRRRLESQAETVGQRIGKIETAVGLIERLRERIERAESVVGAENLRGIVREVAGGLVAQAAPSLLEKALPAVLAALGWTGPPSIALILGIRLAAALLKRRATKRLQSPASNASPPAASQPVYDDYAKQLAGVFALSGRSPTADATLGREYDEELRRAAESSDGVLARWAKTLRDRVARRFYRIHSEAPSPAEPAEEK